MADVKSDIEIARAAKKQPIMKIGAALGIPEADLLPYGHDKAKISASFIKRQASRPNGKLILVTAINPTPAGEGKTTTTVGLGDGLNAIGKKAAICLREPSLGPCFGVKGGAAGGGYAQVVPMEDINLHFTGDFHAITAAHNLLSALIDNHIYWGNEQGIDTRRVAWRRVMDMNDRALREIVCSLGGVSNGYPREAGFDITVASEVMAILCLAKDLDDLEKRLGDIIVAYRRDKSAVYARDLKADGAMTVLLKEAMQPNLVQTLENNPAFIHGGPFANIAHGCNSVVATTTALKLADYVVTEAGFGADSDGAVEQSSLERNCVGGHIHAEQRPSGFDPQRLEQACGPGIFNRALVVQRRYHRIPTLGGHPDRKIRKRHVVCPDDPKIAGFEMTEDRKFDDIRGRSSKSGQHVLNDERGLLSEHDHLPSGGSVVENAHIFGEDQLIETRGK